LKKSICITADTFKYEIILQYVKLFIDVHNKKERQNLSNIPTTHPFMKIKIYARKQPDKKKKKKSQHS